VKVNQLFRGKCVAPETLVDFYRTIQNYVLEDKCFVIEVGKTVVIVQESQSASPFF
jgi:hypothetical protein